MYFGVFYWYVSLKLDFLTNFQTFSTFRPKEVGSDITKIYIIYKISDRLPSNFHTWRGINAQGVQKTVRLCAARIELFSILERGGRFIRSKAGKTRTLQGR